MQKLLIKILSPLIKKSQISFRLLWVFGSFLIPIVVSILVIFGLNKETIAVLGDNTENSFYTDSTFAEQNLNELMSWASFSDPVCGNNVTEPGEACDGTDLNGYTCSSVAAGFKSGTLSCLSDCTGYNVSSCVQGNTIQASSCSQVDVQAAIDLAANGDTVAVPAGECTWTTPVTIGQVVNWGPPTTFESKNIVIQGAGIDQTIINDETGDLWNERPFWIECQEGKPFRITGFTFKGMKRRSSTEPAINTRGYCKNWRIDHNKFDLGEMEPGTQGRGVIVGSYGLVDHNIFVNAYQGVAVQGDGDASWERPQSLGTAEAVYIEDNVFDNSLDYQGDGANDAYGGARYVFRYNTLTNAGIGHHGLDSGGYRSPHSFEIYNNTQTMTKDNWWYGTRYRGGTGVVFNNNFLGNYNGGLTIGVVNYRTCCEISHDNCGNWGRCDNKEDIFCSETWQRCTTDSDCPQGESCDRILDGHQDSTGYPCSDQVGRTTDEDNDGLQDLSPLYEWNNRVNGFDADISVNDPWGCEDPSMADHLKEGRDFINDTQKPNYTPYVYPHPLVKMDEDQSNNEVSFPDQISSGTSFFAYNINLRGGYYIASGNVLGDAKEEIITGTGEGFGPQVRISDQEGYVKSQFFAYFSFLRSGVRVASCDLTGDEKEEIITAPGPGGRPHIRIFNYLGEEVLPSFFALDGKFKGGAYVACGDVSGDGNNEIIVTAGKGGGPHVTVHNAQGNILANFFAYDQHTFHHGVKPAALDFDNDGKMEIITGPEYGSPHIQMFSVQPGQVKQLNPGFFAFAPEYKGGVSVAGGDTNGDGKDEILIGVGENARPHVKIYNRQGTQILHEFYGYTTNFLGGINVSTGDIDGDGQDELLLIPRSQGGPQVRIIEGDKLK